MKSAFLTALTLVALGLASTAVAAPKARTVAIYPLQPLGTDQQIALRLEELLYAQVARIQGVKLVPREQALKVLESQTKPCDGGLGCLAEMGKAAKVTKLVYGTVASLGDSYVLDLKLVDVQSRREARRHSVSLSGDQAVLIEGIRAAATQLIAPEQYIGSLELRLNKPGAEVYIDGDLVGTTPLAPINNLEPGKHALKIVLTGFTDFDRFVDVRFERVTLVNVALTGTSIDATIEAVAAPDSGGSPPVLVVAPDTSGAAPAGPASVWDSPLFLAGAGTVVAGTLALVGGGIAMLMAYSQFQTLDDTDTFLTTKQNDAGEDMVVLKEDADRALFESWFDSANTAWLGGQVALGLGTVFVLGGGGLILWDLLARPAEVEPAGE